MSDTPKLFRVILQVPDLDRAATFYGTLLDLDGRRVDETRCYFDCGPVILALVDPTSGGEAARPNADNIYLAVNDLESIHERAAALGCLSEDEVHGRSAGEIVKRPWGERSFYVTDPFGNQLCFVDSETVFTGL
jgi:catechol 2,3-dioxygenase-like lactoylglutathione lyase family enzyme